MNVFEFASTYLRPYSRKGDEIIPKLCPFCGGGDKGKDKETFALSTRNQTYNCKRGSCDAHGHFTELCKQYGEEADKEDNYEMFKPKKQYKKPDIEVKPATSVVEDYLALRKISKETIEAMRIGDNGKGNIIFPYYEEGELVFVKYRPARKIKKGEKKAYREPGGKPILWNLDNCTYDEPLYITEGEIDACSLHEAGITNVTSIPSGSEDFSWIENCWEWLEKFTKIILCGDTDKAGRQMVEKTIQKLGSHRVATVELTLSKPFDKKIDANLVLFLEGKDALYQQCINPIDVPIAGLIQLADVEPLDVQNMPSVPTGIKELDKATGGNILGDLTVWTGKRGEGKSTILGQVMLEAVESGNKVCVYSGELNANRFKYWLDLQCAGKENIKHYYDEEKERDICYLDDGVQKHIENWYRNKFFLYDNSVSGNSEEQSILKIFEYAVRRYDVNTFLVDNLMTARTSGSKESDFYLRQVEFVNDLINFAKQYNVHVHLVAHPKKVAGELDNDSVSGRGEITNLAHNVYAIERVEGEEFDAAISVTKNRWEGAKLKVGLKFCKISKRFYPYLSQDNKRYSWERATDPEWLQNVLKNEEE